MLVSVCTLAVVAAPGCSWLCEVSNLLSMVILEVSICSAIGPILVEVSNLFSIVILDVSICSSIDPILVEVFNKFVIFPLGMRQTIIPFVIIIVQASKGDTSNPFC